MSNKFFESVPHINVLYLEQILFSFENLPIVFVCMDERKNRYLCVCNDMIDEEAWLIVQISNIKLLQILNDKDTVLSAFKNKNIIVANRAFGGDIRYDIVSYDGVDKDDLPLEDQFLEMESELQEYIEKINQEAFLNFWVNSTDIDSWCNEHYVLESKTISRDNRTYDGCYSNDTNYFSDMPIVMQVNYKVINDMKENQVHNGNEVMLKAA